MNREVHDVIELDRPIVRWMNIKGGDFLLLNNNKVVQVVDTAFRNQAHLLNNNEEYSWRRGNIEEILVCVYPFTPQETVFVEEDDIRGIWINPSELKNKK